MSGQIEIRAVPDCAQSAPRVIVVPADPVLVHIDTLEDSATYLAAALPTSREPARILASVAALRRQATPRRELPAGWGWDDSAGPDYSSILTRGRGGEIAAARGTWWRVYRGEDSSRCVAERYDATDGDDARLAAEDYLWANGWPT